MTGLACRHIPLRGLYVILDVEACQGRDLADLLARAASGGARLFQYRDKRSSMADAYRRAGNLARLARDLGALFIVNDRCDLALAVNADGVHLGQDDLPLAMARRVMGPGKLIGISTHRPEQVEAATAGGADYLGFGPLFPTGTKPDHEPVVGLEGLRRVRSLTTLPLFAIGGVGLAEAAAVAEAGADGIAVVRAILAASDVQETARAFMACLAAANRRAPG